MKFVAVKSSNIEAVAYEPGTMLVRFSGGAVYRYRGVQVQEHAALMAAESLGAHLAKHIKHKFSTDRLTPEQVAQVVKGDDGADAAAPTE